MYRTVARGERAAQAERGAAEGAERAEGDNRGAEGDDQGDAAVVVVISPNLPYS